MKFALVVIETSESKRLIQDNELEHRKSIEGWMAQQAATGKLISGKAFDVGEGAPVTVRHANGSVAVTEGAFTSDTETLGGYFIVDVADREEAVELARSWPTPETIEVRPLWVAA